MSIIDHLSWGWRLLTRQKPDRVEESHEHHRERLIWSFGEHASQNEAAADQEARRILFEIEYASSTAI